MAEELLTIAELAERAGVAENTARRYVRVFEEFFAGRQDGRAMRYPEVVSPLLSLISSCYREGLAAPDIISRLGAVVAAREASVRPAEEPPVRDETAARLDALEEMRREFAMVRDTVGVLWREHRSWRESSSVIEVLTREVTALRAEMAGVSRESGRIAARLASLEGEKSEATAGRDNLEADLARLQSVQDRIAERLDRLADAVGPDEEFLMLPLVFRSEKGEFLGVSANPRKHFSLRDFLELIDHGAGKKRNLATRWSQGKEGRWTLCIAESPGQPLGRRHQVQVKRTKTPRGNTVALIEKLTYAGRDMPVFFLYELFRQIGKGFAEPHPDEE